MIIVKNTTGNIKVSIENIFPMIKKFLYSDREIFLRELISNASDATSKIKTLIQLGEVIEEMENLKIEIKINKETKTLHVIDKGIGMTSEEVEKYINQIAFSGAEEFVDKYKEKGKDHLQSIIGHFGLGFYSSFMVSERVEIFSKSYKNVSAVHWICDGSPTFTIKETDKKKKRGTEIILHISDESKEFLEENSINGLIKKYCKYISFPIKFGSREEKKKNQAGIDEKIIVDNIVNCPKPIWTKNPIDLKNEDYLKFYRDLYPMQFSDPLFWIHLNIEHPFHLKGVLFFPKIKNGFTVDKIQLYKNKVYVTDNLEGIVPDFLKMLLGVIDSNDIPLNASRSNIQSDSTVKKISNYITRKVSDKLEKLFKNNREELEKKWESMKIIIEYGLITDEKFFERSKKFYIYPNVDGKYFTFEDFTNRIKDSQKDNKGNLIYLYASDKESQHSYIKSAKKKGYEILLLQSPLTSHLVQKLEMKNNGISFVRVDSDHIEKLIDKKENGTLSNVEKEKLKKMIEVLSLENNLNIRLETLQKTDLPFMITVPEFMLRIKEMSLVENRVDYLNLSNRYEKYNLVVNVNHQLMKKILLEEDESKRENIIKDSIDLALLSKNMLSGEPLTNFIYRSFEKISSENSSI
ncbi:MAG TPA: molecular chaperone HtpG [Candidatus Angelobacter sp.]|jgi:molecular chaperone HtpG|nr:molecular chaperone HtpG [Candidatus Angelobacter sp.]